METVCTGYDITSDAGIVVLIALTFFFLGRWAQKIAHWG